jgi:hypothetical protein
LRQRVVPATTAAIKTMQPAPTPLQPKKEPIPQVRGQELNSTNLSIKGLKEKHELEQARNYYNQDNLPRNPFTFDEFMRQWRVFTQMMKEEGLDTFYNALLRRSPIEVTKNHFVLEVDNQIQVDYIQAHLEKMVSFFREELKNYELDISIRITDKPDEEIKFLTGKDKFTAMTRKNPLLHTLKSTFNLDIEY